MSYHQHLLYKLVIYQPCYEVPHIACFHRPECCPLVISDGPHTLQISPRISINNESLLPSSKSALPRIPLMRPSCRGTAQEYPLRSSRDNKILDPVLCKLVLRAEPEPSTPKSESLFHEEGNLLNYKTNSGEEQFELAYRADLSLECPHDDSHSRFIDSTRLVLVVTLFAVGRI